jgi:hypothetical protein
MTFGCLCRWHFTTASGMVYFLMFETVVQRSLSKTHVISNHGAKVESECAVLLRNRKFLLIFFVFSAEI